MNSSFDVTAKLYINDGTGNFTEKTGTPFDAVWSSSIAFSDVNGDGYKDVLITGSNVSERPIAKLYINDGGGNFTEKMGTPFDGVWQGSIAFSDVNGDGHKDVLITGSNVQSELRNCTSMMGQEILPKKQARLSTALHLVRSPFWMSTATATKTYSLRDIIGQMIELRNCTSTTGQGISQKGRTRFSKVLISARSPFRMSTATATRTCSLPGRNRVNRANCETVHQRRDGAFHRKDGHAFRRSFTLVRSPFRMSTATAMKTYSFQARTIQESQLRNCTSMTGLGISPK